MIRVELAPEVLDDFDRFLDHLVEHGISDAPDRVAEIKVGLRILSHSPLIGRPVGGGKRELVIGRGSRGYVALYRYFQDAELIVIAAIRGQREASYARDA